MKLLAPTTCLVLLHATIGLAADGNQTSTLIGNGTLQTIKEPTAKILQFKIHDGKLQLDRDGWDAAAKEVEKEKEAAAKLPAGIDPNSPAGLRLRARQLEEQARRMEMTSRMGTMPPVQILFRKLQETAQSHSTSFQGGGSNLFGAGIQQESRSTFRGEKITGRLRTSNDFLEFTLEETQSPKRSIEFVNDGEGGFRLSLTNAEGDCAILRQFAEGRCSIVTMQEGASFTDQDESFVALFKKDRQRMETKILPAFEQFGISLLLPPSSNAVKSAVLISLLRSSDSTREGERLIAELESDAYQQREKAANTLAERFELYQDAIRTALADKPKSYEVQVRLEQIVAQHSDSTAADTVAALDLLHDANFIVSLFDAANPEEIPKITAHLEKITGQSLGNDPAVWKQWVQSKQ